MKSKFLLFSLLICTAANAQNELNVIASKWLDHTDAQNSLYHYLADQAYLLLKQREEKVAAIQSLPDWKMRQDSIKITLENLVGPFPEKTPLNPKIVRSIDKGSFRVEHIIFESQPGFFVTSSLYLPAGLKKNSKYPVIIYCSGHTAEGYRSSVYQHVIMNLVSKGFIVFAFDPVGQGERLEYFDPKTGKSAVGGSTSEHSYPGAQAFLTGSSQAKYMVWDGVRAVDYLLTRKEVDPARIGITGRSGGGTQSAYIAAIDDRIYAAAPENYITNYTRLLQSIGPQDAEQNICHLIRSGLDHPDFLIVRAPKPAMMITTTGDMFSIQGAMETEAEVKRIYRAYGQENNFSRVEDNAAHASTLKNREALYAFFQKHLTNPGDPTDNETEPLTKEELQVTKTGQVSALPGSETVFSLNLKEAMRLNGKVNEERKTDGFSVIAVKMAKKLSGYREPEEVGKPIFTGRIVRDNYVIEKYFLSGEGNYIIPYLLFIPVDRSDKVMIYLHPEGKSAEASAGGEIEKYVSQGITVLAPDLPGAGEMGPGSLKGDAYFKGVSHNLWYASILIGRSITGILAGDVNRLAMVIKRGNENAEIIGFAIKEMVAVMIHAAAFSKYFNKIVLSENYTTYLSIVKEKFYDPKSVMTGVQGAIMAYDLPDLEASLAPGTIVNSVKP